MESLYSLAAILAAYLIGSCSFAVIVSKAMGLADPRSYGSGNPGATNVLRTGNRVAAMLTLALDALKGFVPVLLALWLAPRYGFGEVTIGFVGLAAFMGHLWPLYFGFRGGKGVATAAGALLAINPWLGLATLATWAIVALFFRYSSLASIVAAGFAPFYQLLIWGGSPLVLAIAVMSLLLIWRHSGNLQKLIAGTESKLGQKAGFGSSARVDRAHQISSQQSQPEPSPPPHSRPQPQPQPRAHSHSHSHSKRKGKH